jgi:ribosomal protein L3
MTRIFTEDGVSIPVTVIEVEANRVTQVKDLANANVLTNGVFFTICQTELPQAAASFYASFSKVTSPLSKLKQTALLRSKIWLTMAIALFRLPLVLKKLTV